MHACVALFVVLYCSCYIPVIETALEECVISKSPGHQPVTTTVTSVKGSSKSNYDHPLMYINIRVKDGQIGQIGVFPQDNPKQLANMFVQAFSLDPVCYFLAISFGFLILSIPCHIKLGYY